MASRCANFKTASLRVAAIEARRAAIQSQELLRKNIRKSSAKPNDFVGRNRKLATNSFYVMGEIFLETLMATPAKAVLQLCAAGARTRGAGGTVSDGAEEVAPAIHT